MPVRFEVYKSGQRLSSFQPVGAYAVGPESVPMVGEVAFKDGLLNISRTDNAPTGISLVWDAGPIGAYELETTRLPMREAPYVLNVELARLRLMKIVQKQEDWNLFEFPKAERFLATFKEAQELFAEALGKLDRPAEASVLGDQSLERSIALSEELAVYHAELLLTRRKASNAFVKHIFGCKVDAGVQNQKYRDMIAGNFDYAVLPMPWKVLAPREGQFDTEIIDNWAEALTRRRVPIIAGPLINLDESELPDWMFIWENDFDTVRELAYEHVQRLVSRYRKAVSLWNVAASVSSNKAFTLTFEQMIELTRLLVTQVKNVLPSARTLITISQAFGEYAAKNPTSVAPMLYAEMVAQAGINFDGFALELELGIPEPGHFMRDLFQVSCLLDRFSTLGRPVFITAVGVPGRSAPDPEDRSEGRNDPTVAGRWRRPWDPQLQAEWMEAVYYMALSKPFVESIAWADLADISHSVPGGGLLNDMFQPKPSFEKLQQLRDQFRQWQKKLG